MNTRTTKPVNNAEILAKAKETKDEFYRQHFAVLAEMGADFPDSVTSHKKQPKVIRGKARISAGRKI